MSHFKEILEKIEKKQAVVGIVGLGYVGLPLAVEIAQAGYKTIGFDVQPQKVDMVNKGVNYIGDIVNSVLEDVVKSGKLSGYLRFLFYQRCGLCRHLCAYASGSIPTAGHQYVRVPPSRWHSISIRACWWFRNHYLPRTTEELLQPILEAGGLKCGEDFYLAFSPERVDPGNQQYKTKNTPKVVGGVGEDSTEGGCCAVPQCAGGRCSRSFLSGCG